MNNIVVQKESMVMLGAQGLIKYSDDNIMKYIEKDVVLSFNKNHFWKCETKKKKGNDYVTATSYKLTAEGYEELNRHIGLKVLNEPTFTLNGVEYTNPHIEVDKAGRKKMVIYKLTIYGYTPTGEMYFSPVLLHYSADDDLIAALLAKIRYQKNNDPIGTMVSKAAYAEYKKKNPMSTFIQTDAFGDDDDSIIGLAINTQHDDFISARSAHQEVILNIEKKMQTVAKRNAFRKHPATAIYTVDPTPVIIDGNVKDAIVKVKVVQWVNMDSKKEIEAIKEYMDTGIIEPQKYEDVVDEDPIIDIDHGESFDIEEDVVEVDIISEMQEEVDASKSEHTDVLEKDTINTIKWIRKSQERVNKNKYDALVKGIELEKLSFVELTAIADKIAEMEK